MIGDKREFLRTIFVIWFIAATSYIAYDQYAGYIFRISQTAYQQGYAKSVAELMDQAEKSGCAPFNVSKDDKKIQLINGQCLPDSANASAVNE